MFSMFRFENRFASVVEKKIIELLSDNDISERSVAFFKVTDDNPNFLVMASDSVDEGLPIKLIREFDWESIGVMFFKELIQA